MDERWRPSVTVAAVIEHDGRFLLVEEHTPEGLKLNNPAGHLEPGESPLEAVVREALEETGREFVPEALLGVYLARFVRPARDGGSEASGAAEDITYLRFAYRGRVGEPVPDREIDRQIVRTLWLTRDEIAAESARHRSPLVMRCIDDHVAGRRQALDLVQADPSLRTPIVLAPVDAVPGEETPAEGAHALRARADDAPGAGATEPPQAPAPQTMVPMHEAPAHAEGASAAADSAEAPAAAPPTTAQASADVEGAAASATLAPAAPHAPSAPSKPPEPTLAETAAALAERFPALFAPAQPRPIKLRIQADIQQRAPGAFTKKHLSIFLHRHTTSTAYLRALVASTQRFDLDGQPAGELAAEHLEAARAELERRRQIVLERRARERGRPPQGSPPIAAAAGGANGPPSETPGAEGAPAQGRRPARDDRPHSNRPTREERAPRGGPPQQAARPPRPARPQRAERPAHGQGAGRERTRGGPERAAPRGPRGPRGPGAPGGPGGPPMPRAPRDDAHAPPTALPEDPERRERALLLRSFEGSPLTAANFCALKGLALGEFELQIALARREREERQRGAGA